MFSFFKKRDDEAHNKIDSLHKSLDHSFSKIKEDISNVGEWITHFEEHKKIHHSKIENIDERLRALEELILENNKQKEAIQTTSLSKQPQTAVRSKQLSKHVQTAVQTPLQEMLVSLTPMERTVFWALLNTDLKLSYSDLRNLLGKDESTVRGQVTNINRKIQIL